MGTLTGRTVIGAVVNPAPSYFDAPVTYTTAAPVVFNAGVTYANQSVTPATPTSAATPYSSSGQLAEVNSQGLQEVLVGSFGSVGATSVTVATTASETILQSASIPANDPIAGTVYRMKGWGVYSDTATPTLTFTSRWGGVAGTTLQALAATTLGSGVSNLAFSYELLLNFATTTTVNVALTLDLGTSNSTNATTRLTGVPSAAVTVTSNAAKVLCTTVTWSASSASNTLTLLGGFTERVW